jgi:hypothetical protein
MIDDAAITMAYAANWTAGYGLVAQPGLPPVEGYSNPLWLAVLAILNLAGAMNAPGIKLVSLALVGLSLRSFSAATEPLMPPTARIAVLLLLATASRTWG